MNGEGETAAIEARLRQALDGWAPHLEMVGCRPLEGGHSGMTLLVELQGGEHAQVVAKCGGLGRPAVGRHDVLRQARVIDALHEVADVSVPYVLHQDDGEPQVFLMTFEPGDATEPVLDGGDELGAGLVETRARAAARMLGALHAVAVDRVGLSEEPSVDLPSELDRWCRVMDAVDPDLVAGADDVAMALRASLPASTGPAIVHGDYRLGNILFDGSRPAGIIDWEIWSLTDPRVDLAWFLIECDHRNYPVVGTQVPGMPGFEELIADYEGVAGPVADLPWFMAFGRFKTAAIMAHNLRRHREGRYHDPFQERLPPTIAAMIRGGLEFVSQQRGARVI